MSTLVGGLPTHPQNPHSWRTSLSLLVWSLSYGVSCSEALPGNKVPAGIARKVTETRNPPPPKRQGLDNRGS